MTLMQEETRYERAARELAERGERVSHVRLDRWLRETEGRGCSPRDSTPIVQRYRKAASARIAEAVEIALQALERLNPSERHQALNALRRRYRGAK
jgi:hypothetical protein